MTIGICFLWSCVSEKTQEILRAKYVVVIGFDSLEKANTPTFDTLIKEGASLDAISGLVTIKFIEDSRLLKKINKDATYMETSLLALKKKHPVFGD
ncbi:hypothetical protein [Flavivirga spongiicola]|uniref:CHASE2 domain-containing protein n=1 Tax=Flavivirga spongiicola TaxID=421621 RepID=A0ABU7XTB8_9FLAO|nr:hypothetical protein [Flavivirga sp. MEBiC05379]MDO5979026.1 hypothetical protein [Flavivirga sp. MEBiC05379]